MWVSAAAAGPFDTGQERDGYRLIVSPPARLLLQGAILRGDGMVEIPAGRHCAEANAYHAEFCAAYGLQDSTDSGDVAFSASSGDMISCVAYTPEASAKSSRIAPPPFVEGPRIDEDGRVYSWVPIAK